MVKLALCQQKVFCSLSCGQHLVAFNTVAPYLICNALVFKQEGKPNILLSSIKIQLIVANSLLHDLFTVSQKSYFNFKLDDTFTSFEPNEGICSRFLLLKSNWLSLSGLFYDSLLKIFIIAPFLMLFTTAFKHLFQCKVSSYVQFNLFSPLRQ